MELLVKAKLSQSASPHLQGRKHVLKLDLRNYPPVIKRGLLENGQSIDGFPIKASS